MAGDVNNNTNPIDNTNTTMTGAPPVETQPSPIADALPPTGMTGDVSARPNPAASMDNPMGNPAQQPHHVFRSIMETLAGPRYTYKIDANTGQMQRIPVQRTKTQLADMIVAGALTGLFAGAGAKGPNNVGQAVARGGQASMEMFHNLDQDEQQKAKDDFARHASIYETNLRTMLNQRQLGQMDMNMHKEITEAARPLYEELLKYPGAIIADNVPEHELLKYGATKANAIPVRFVQETGPDGKPTGNIEDIYAVLDPNFKTKIPKETLQYLADMGVKGFSNSDGKPINLPENQLMSIRTLNNAMQQANALKLFGSTMQNVNKVNVGTAGPKINDPEIQDKIETAAKKYGVDPSILSALIMEESQGNPKAKSPKGAMGLGQLMPATAKNYGVTDAFDVDQNLDATAHYLSDLMKQKGKPELALAAYHGIGSDGNTTDQEYVNKIMGMVKPSDANTPDLKKLISSDPTFPEAVRYYQKYLRADVADSVKAMQEAEAEGKIPAGYTGKIVNALGGQGALEQYEQQQKANQARANAEATQPIKEQAAADKLERENKIANQWSDKYLTSAPDDFELSPDARFMEEKELKGYLEKAGVKLPPEFAGLYAVAHNKANLKTFAQKTYKGTEEASAAKALSYIRQYINPTYDETQFPAAQKLREELYSTRQNVGGGVVLSAGTASNHLDLLAQVADALQNHNLQDLNKIKTIYHVKVGDSPQVLFKAIADQVNQEVGKVVAGGTPHEAELQKLDQNLSTAESPEQIRSVISGYINLMQGRLSELNYRSQDLLGEPLRLSPQVAKVFGNQGIAVPGYGNPVVVGGKLLGFTQDGKTLNYKFTGE